MVDAARGNYGITGLWAPQGVRVDGGAVGAPGGGGELRTTALGNCGITGLREGNCAQGGEGDIGPFTITDLTGLRKGEAIGVMGYGRARADY